MTELACRDCLYVSRDTEVCPACGSDNLTDDWSGYVAVVDPETSEIAAAMEVEMKGKYALKVR
ncbi:MAG: transcription elongation factor subunit Spt4 [Halobacteriota archaeon]